VSSSDESVDPVGACVGNRGNRVQAVVDELNDEKIDIIPWSDEIESNIKNALAPAVVEKIVFDEEENRSTAVVPDFQLSLALGKEGQNVRLAARLCSVKIDIKSHSQFYGQTTEELLEVPDTALDEDGFYNVEEFLNAVEESDAEESDQEAAEEAAAADEAAEETAAETEAEVPVIEAEATETEAEEAAAETEEDAAETEAEAVEEAAAPAEEEQPENE